MPAKDYNNYMKAYMLKRYHTRRKYAIELLGGLCSLCGSADKLVFDHITPEEKSFGISKLWSVSKKRFEEELKKCRVLCETCHIARHATAKGTHGTVSSYRYCKCDLCREANNAWSREYKRKRRASMRAVSSVG